MKTGAAFSPRQLEARGAVPCAVTIYEGAIRSGKTFTWILKMLAAVAEMEKPRGRLVIVGRSLYTVWRNVFEPIFEDDAFLGFRAHVKYKLGENTAVIFGRTVHVIGAADKKAAPRIQGMTVELAFVDELSLVPRELFEQRLGRMSVDGAQLIATTNPDSPAHWLKGYLDKVDKVDDRGEPLLPGWTKYRFLMDDNPSCRTTTSAARRPSSPACSTSASCSASGLPLRARSTSRGTPTSTSSRTTTRRR